MVVWLLSVKIPVVIFILACYISIFSQNDVRNTINSMHGLEKYQLVGLISGCTVFIVAFWLLIDFCVYRKNRQIKREKRSYIMDSRPGPENRMALPFSSDAQRITPRSPTTTPPPIIRQERDGSFRKILKFFNIVKENSSNDGKSEHIRGVRSKSIAIDSLIKDQFLLERNRRFSEGGLSTNSFGFNDESNSPGNALENPKSFLAALKNEHNNKNLDTVVENESESINNEETSSTSNSAGQGKVELPDILSKKKKQKKKPKQKHPGSRRLSMESDNMVLLNMKHNVNGESNMFRGFPKAASFDSAKFKKMFPENLQDGKQIIKTMYGNGKVNS